METRSSTSTSPLRWRDALQRILALLEGHPCHELWRPRPDEMEMLQMAGLGPLLADHLEGDPSFPALFAEQVLNGRRIATHRRVLADLWQRLEGRARAPVVFKGMAACDELYQRPELRVFTDVDLLIPPDELVRWQEVIRSMGGRCADRQVFGSRGFSARRYFEHVFQLPDGEGGHVDLDLHLSFGPRQRYPMAYDDVAPACRRSEHGPYLVLEPLQWICVLAIHQVRALFVWSYQDYVDLFQILRKWPVEPGRLEEVARAFGSCKASAILLRNLTLVLPEGCRVQVPDLTRWLPPGHQEFAEQLRLPVASRPLGDASFLRNAGRVARLSDSWLGLARYAAAYVTKRGLDLVVRPPR